MAASPPRGGRCVNSTPPGPTRSRKCRLESPRGKHHPPPVTTRVSINRPWGLVAQIAQQTSPQRRRVAGDMVGAFRRLHAHPGGIDTTPRGAGPGDPNKRPPNPVKKPVRQGPLVPTVNPEPDPSVPPVDLTISPPRPSTSTLPKTKTVTKLVTEHHELQRKKHRHHHPRRQQQALRFKPRNGQLDFLLHRVLKP